MGMLMGVWGWWAFDIFTLMASYMSIQAMSAQTILRSLGLLSFMIPVGFSTACGILVGRAIGYQSVYETKFYYMMCVYLSVAAALVQNVLLFAFQDYIISAFTDIEIIAGQMQQAWIMFNIFVIFDCTQGIAKTVLTASGQQKYGAIFTFVAYFVIGIPTSMLMVFYFKVGIWGLWLGPTLACAFNTAVYLIIFKMIDWEKLIAKLAEQREKDKI